MIEYSIFSCSTENALIKTSNSYVSKNVGILSRDGKITGNNIKGNSYKFDSETTLEIINIWKKIENRDLTKDIEFYINMNEQINYFNVKDEQYLSFLSKDRAKNELKELFTGEDSKILNFNMLENNKINIIINFDLILEDKNQGNINLNNNTCENIYWIIYGEAIFINTNIIGIIIAYGDIIVKNSQINGKLISISGNIFLDSNSRIN